MFRAMVLASEQKPAAKVCRAIEKNVVVRDGAAEPSTYFHSLV